MRAAPQGYPFERCFMPTEPRWEMREAFRAQHILRRAMVPSWDLSLRGLDEASGGIVCGLSGLSSTLSRVAGMLFDEARADIKNACPRLLGDEHGYDYSLPTFLAFRHPDYVVDSPAGTSATKVYDESLHGPLYGEFTEIRRKFDYSWHTNYTRERQLWQDKIVRGILQSSLPRENPWIIFTGGAMGAGKGYVMRHLSKHTAFPLEDMVCVDPDHFKHMMPEWDGYIKLRREDAGTLCHKESGFIQELAQEAAMVGHRNLWIDGSLSDAEWYRNVFRDVRERFPRYRIAIVYVHCAPEQVHAQAARRGLETGRVVPRPMVEKSIRMTRRSINILAPLADFAAHVDNRKGQWVSDTHKRLPQIPERKVSRGWTDLVAAVNKECSSPVLRVFKMSPAASCN